MNNAQVVWEMLRAVEARDGGRLFDLYHPEVEFKWPPGLPGYGGRHQGTRQVLAMAEAFSALWDPLQPTADWRDLRARLVAVDGDSVVAHYHQRGIDRAGRTCDSEVLAHYELDAGKVRRLEMYYLDPLAVRDFLARATQGTADPSRTPGA